MLESDLDTKDTQSMKNNLSFYVNQINKDVRFKCLIPKRRFTRSPKILIKETYV